MPKQNRITPTGEIITTAARGTLMGNRGILHDDNQRIVRFFKGKAWIFCQLKFEGVRRSIMSPGSYTELFFLDEATALSAGHRPCAHCMRDRYKKFCDCWKKANPSLLESYSFTAKRLDDVLHSERLNPNKSKQTYLEEIDNLPSGCFILLESHKNPYLVLENVLLEWTPEGYIQHLNKPAAQKVQVLTPHSVIRALGEGFRPKLHDSAFQEFGINRV